MHGSFDLFHVFFADIAGTEVGAMPLFSRHVRDVVGTVIYVVAVVAAAVVDVNAAAAAVVVDTFRRTTARGYDH